MSSKAALIELLGKPIRIVLQDGRVLDGNLQCMDKDLNFIIGEASEFHGVEDASNFVSADVVCRSIGSAMIPGIHIVKILALPVTLPDA
ncbi:hypothetical protein B484DRAFT_455027 [Ochromonadaceae sp. CCMP2298]|nr:hypothetical protein B484DRAFT_455027 [Ochromonadaceae sp. CCMP2298]|mmetsp:Transcript_10940/g.24263  ORF Transcript_10940/g.24263 Transcript_10940/m.24263 type:complete len:89 (-) Transcript_10940:397-663(-)